MYYFYSSEVLSHSNEQVLPEDESFHAMQVLRLKSEEYIIVTDGKGNSYKAQLAAINKGGCRFVVHEVLPQEKPSCSLNIAMTPTKNADRFEWFLEKMTEIGVTQIFPIFTEHSERNRLNMNRCNKIVVAALKQSQKSFLPIIHQPVSFHVFIEQHLSSEHRNYIAHCRSTQKVSFQKILALHNPESVTVLVGPEGDFSAAEVEKAEKVGFLSVSLGQSRLRTETAGIVAGHTVQLYWENRLE